MAGSSDSSDIDVNDFLNLDEDSSPEQPAADMAPEAPAQPQQPVQPAAPLEAAPAPMEVDPMQPVAPAQPPMMAYQMEPPLVPQLGWVEPLIPVYHLAPQQPEQQAAVYQQQPIAPQQQAPAVRQQLPPSLQGHPAPAVRQQRPRTPQVQPVAAPQEAPAEAPESSESRQRAPPHYERQQEQAPGEAAPPVYIYVDEALVRNCRRCPIVRVLMHVNGRRKLVITMHGVPGNIVHALVHHVPRDDEENQQIFYVELENRANVNDIISEWIRGLSMDDSGTFYDSDNSDHVAQPLNPVPPTARRPKGLSLYSVQRMRCRSLNLDDLLRHIHVSSQEAALNLFISHTSLKQIARRVGLSKWPSRQIAAIDSRIRRVEDNINNANANANAGDLVALNQEKNQFREQRRQLYAQILADIEQAAAVDAGANEEGEEEEEAAAEGEGQEQED